VVQRILVAIGTRPEAIKLAPVIAALKAAAFPVVDCLVTAQHTDLLEPMLQFFGLKPDYDLQVMQHARTLDQVAAAILTGTAQILRSKPYDAVIVQGDTTTAFATGLAAFYQQVPVAHVEAGLRSGDLDQPFPEEAHRRFVDLYARWYFAPTDETVQNLKNEHISVERIFRVGNTGIDALLQTRARLPELGVRLPLELTPGEKLLLVTCHRRESFGEPLRRIFAAIEQIARETPGLQVVIPVHPNPHVREAAETLRSRPRIHLLDPLDYPRFVLAMDRADLIISDSGGVQEEAPILGTPVLVTRETTERPEAVTAGANELVGTDPSVIVRRARELLAQPVKRPACAVYGDGTSSRQIAEILKR
jgi:UDP-N-acetylglucosamine 2-epimerase (non-hydrolysing)